MEEIVINFDTIITIGKVISALAVIAGVITGAVKYFKKLSEYKNEIDTLKTKQAEIAEEQFLQIKMFYAIFDGLHQLGCNGKTTEASQELDEYIKRKAYGIKKEI